MIADITSRKLAEEAVQNVSRKLIEGQEQERTRIARELHDDVGQRLALLTVELEQFAQDRECSAEIRKSAQRLHDQASELATDIQNLSHALHSSKLEYLGLVTAAKSFCREFEDTRKVTINFTADEFRDPIPADISLCLYRVLQESLNNSAKHSCAREFDVRLWRVDDAIHLTVRDDGVGFDVRSARQGHGLGLVSMEERVKLVGGDFSIRSSYGKGTMVHARVALVPRAPAARAAGQ